MGIGELRGWTDFHDIYNETAVAARDDSVLVEVGVAFGSSIAYLARRLIDLKKRSELYAVDSWPMDHTTWTTDPSLALPKGAFYTFCAGMVQAAPEELERINVIRAPSVAAAALIARLGGADFVFIDAAHDYDNVRADIAAWLPVMRAGGVIAGHDCNADHPGVVQAVRERFGDSYLVRGNSWWKQL
jgi:predicted O-methyltransferase YrrM